MHARFDATTKAVVIQGRASLLTNDRVLPAGSYWETAARSSQRIAAAQVQDLILYLRCTESFTVKDAK